MSLWCEKTLPLKEELSYVVTSTSQGLKLRTNDRNCPPVVIGQEDVSPKDGWNDESEERSSLDEHFKLRRADRPPLS